MKLIRSTTTAVLAASLLGASLFASPAHAQRSSGCTQEAAGGNTNPGRGASTQTQPANSQQTLVGVINAAISNVSVLSGINGIDALNGALAGSAVPVQVVCLNDALNQNDVRLLQNILNNSPILNDNLNNSLNGNEVLNNLLRDSDITLLENVEVVAIDVNTREVYVLRQ